MAGGATERDVDGRRVQVSNLGKVLYPASGTTKGDVIDYYAAIAPVMVPVTSGSTGIHLYLGLEGDMTFDQASGWARTLAHEVREALPDLVTDRMAKSERSGKVFIDWSQNNAAKTTVAPYSLRGRKHPWVAAPRRWQELDDPELAQLGYSDVLRRVNDIGDPMADLGIAARAGGSARHRSEPPIR